MTEPVTLNALNLPAIAALGVPTPTYERSALPPRILHVGVGGFHRAHLAVYTDELAVDGADWRIRGVGLLAADRRMADVMQRQDHLYTLIERDGDDTQPRVVGSIVDFALAAGDQAAFDRLVADPELAILSLTITEGGYSVATPNPTVEAIVSGLEARRRANAGPLTILSCDNLPGNGDAARHAVTTVANTTDATLGAWVERSCTFPNSMVDRITPQTTDGDRAWLRDAVGIDDGWPVVCETFRQWVVEDEFAAGRPHWEHVGALFTNRVHDWELYKLRMLNASHSCMAYLAALAGIVYVDEAVGVPAVRRYLVSFLEREAIPTLPQIPGHPAADYAATTLRRFENTGVRDQISRLCIDGTAKFPSFLIPTIEAQLERGGHVTCAALALAAWHRYLATTPAAVRAPDSRGDRAVELATSSLGDPAAFLELREVFTPPLQQNSTFRDAFVAACRRIAELGAIGAIEATIA